MSLTLYNPLQFIGNFKMKGIKKQNKFNNC